MTVRRVKRSVLLPFSATGVFGLVADIERYPEFLPWCTGSELLQQAEGEVVACIEVCFRGVKERLVTRNSLTAGSGIAIDLVEGPFRFFQGGWTFTVVGAQGCGTDLEVAYEFDSRLLGLAVGPFVSGLADERVDAFAARAKRVLVACG